MRIFISYAKSDREFVDRLAGDLDARVPDAQVFYDRRIQPGASWAEALDAEIKRAEAIVVVLSPDSLESPWVQSEVNIALEQHLQGRARLLPLLVRPCRPTGPLAAIAWVDFTGDYAAALDRLIGGIADAQAQPAPGPPPAESKKLLDAMKATGWYRQFEAALASFRSEGAPPAAEPPAATSPRVRASVRKRCFVVMPFGREDLEAVYEIVVKPTLEGPCQLDVHRGDDVFGSNVIMNDIVASIRDCDIVLADLTAKNANVFYEVGICHALEKPVLLLAQAMDDVPFDLRHRRVLLYESTLRGGEKLKTALRDNMNAVLRGN